MFGGQKSQLLRLLAESRHRQLCPKNVDLSGLGARHEDSKHHFRAFHLVTRQSCVLLFFVQHFMGLRTTLLYPAELLAGSGGISLVVLVFPCMSIFLHRAHCAGTHITTRAQTLH